MNGFEKHGISYTSPSQLNMYAAAPCAWVAQYLFKKRGAYGVAAQIGILVEDVVKHVLTGGCIEEAISAAENRFRKQTAIGVSEKDRDRISNIRDMAEIAVEELAPYGEPEYLKTIKGYEQQRIELNCNGAGWVLPVIGYLDFVFPSHNLIVDLKTTLRAPSVISAPHKRQGAIYAKAKGFDCKFLYVTPKKSVWHDIEDIDETLTEVKTILNRQEKFLRLGDKDKLKESVPVNMDTFYWTGAEQHRDELYGL